MADEPASVEPVATQVQRSPFYRIIYSDASKMRMMPHAIGITFGVMTDIPGSNAVNLVLEEVHIVLAYGQAKLIAEQLSMSIAAYEREFGAVPRQEPVVAEGFLKIAIDALKNLHLMRPK